MNVAQLLTRAGRSFGDRPAIAIGPDDQQTYAVLAEKVARMASTLGDHPDLEPGDRVALVMRNVPAYLEALFAVWHAGLVAVPINAKLHQREFAYILEHCGARLCLVTPDLTGTVEAAAADAPGLRHIIDVDSPEYGLLAGGTPREPAARAGNDPAWLFYTSGTTGRPKGAMLSHRNLMTMTAGYFTDVDPVACTNSLLHAAPMSHGSGLYILPHVAAGARNVIPASGGFDPDEIFHLLESHPEVSFFSAPTMVKRLTVAARNRDIRVGNLKTVVYGGGPMYLADIEDALARFGNRFVQIYGQGETPMTITALAKRYHIDREHPRYRERLGSVGIPQSLIEVRVTDEAGRTLPPGDLGEVRVRGDSVMLGYWRDQAATDDTLVDGWLCTGDIGTFDEDGFLALRDRSRDVIITGGANVYPREVEEVLLAHPDVDEVAVIGEPHPDWGEVVAAIVVPASRRRPADQELDAFCLEHIARFKRPKVYRHVDELPKNAYGKVLKTVLRAQGPEADG